MGFFLPFFLLSFSYNYNALNIDANIELLSSNDYEIRTCATVYLSDKISGKKILESYKLYEDQELLSRLEYIKNNNINKIFCIKKDITSIKNKDYFNIKYYLNKVEHLTASDLEIEYEEGADWYIQIEKIEQAVESRKKEIAYCYLLIDLFYKGYSYEEIEKINEDLFK